MITVDQALAIVLERINPLGPEEVPLEEALGRILQQDVRADIDLPPFDRARMDGYALRAQDLATAPASLKLIGEIAAGASFEGVLSPGEAVKIFTGAPLPRGADSVQKVEVTSSNGKTVTINEAVKPGQFVTARGSEAAIGDILARSGRAIGAAEMAVLASFGYPKVTVGRQPRVAILSTGSELIPVEAKPAGAQIRNSNTYTIGSYARAAGARVEILGTIEDTAAATRDSLERAAEGRDLVITSGGVSMGDYDLVKGVLVEMGAEVFFDKVSIRPGKPTVFARRGSTFFFGLPGNPVSTSVTFNVFARPALRKMQGSSSPMLPTVEAELVRGLTDSSSRQSYLPARFRVVGGRAFAEPLKWGGSSDLVAFMEANALIVVDQEVHQIGEGEKVDLMILGELLPAESTGS